MAHKKSPQTKRDVVKSNAKSDARATNGKKKDAAKKSEAQTKERPVKTDTGDAYRVLIGPIITEKSARLAEQGTYVFAVAPEANKISVGRAVKEVYGVDPVKVTTSRQAGKAKMFSQRRGRRAGIHKAFVTLKDGQAIELFEKI